MKGQVQECLSPDNRIRILHDGSVPKFIESVFKVVFSGHQAIKYGREILYVTERAVFKLTKNGIILEEIAPGIDLDRDIISKMDFMPMGKWMLEMRSCRHSGCDYQNIYFMTRLEILSKLMPGRVMMVIF